MTAEHAAREPPWLSRRSAWSPGPRVYKGPGACCSYVSQVLSSTQTSVSERKRVLRSSVRKISPPHTLETLKSQRSGIGLAHWSSQENQLPRDLTRVSPSTKHVLPNIHRENRVLQDAGDTGSALGREEYCKANILMDARQTENGGLWGERTQLPSLSSFLSPPLSIFLSVRSSGAKPHVPQAQYSSLVF